MNDWIESTELAGALLKGCLVLLTTSLFAMLLRNTSATSLYRVWLFGACMSLLVAVASLLAPVCNLDVPIEQVQVGARATNRIAPTPSAQFAAWREESSTNITSMHSPSDERSTGVLLRKVPNGSNHHLESDEHNHEERDQAKPAALTSSDQTERAEVASDLLLTKALQALLLTILNWWPMIWLVGVVAILLQTLVQHLRALTVLNQCEKLEDRTLSQLCRDVARRVAIPTPELLVLDEAVVPFVVGLWKPRVVLPLESAGWTKEKVTFVMLHELAHIKRRDLPTQLISRVALAVYWFNPLSWWGYSQLMRLRELACDDWVLQREKKPGSYAEILLDVANRYRSHSQPMVIGMSGKVDVARRIHSALDATRARTPFSTRTSRCVAGLALVLCLVLGAMQLRSRAVEPQDGTPNRKIIRKETGLTGDSQKEKEVDEEARSMIIKVLDENDQPLSGVDVYVTGIDYHRRGGNGNLPRIHYPTDASGSTTIRFREGTVSLQLWPRKPGYVPQYVRFDEKEMTLPSEYTFYFEKGSKTDARSRFHRD